MKSLHRIMMIGTIAFVITISSTIWSNSSSANLFQNFDEADAMNTLAIDINNKEEELYEILGFESNEQLQDATYTHQSLTAIAEIQNVDVQGIITLQSAQLMEQIDERLAKGQLTLNEYITLSSEIPDIIRRSVYGE